MKEKLTYCPILKTNINVTNMEEAVNYIDKNIQELRGKYICISRNSTTYSVV